MCKGFEPGSRKLPHQLIAELLPAHRQTGVLSGPSFAQEVAHGYPTALTLASHDNAMAHHFAETPVRPPPAPIYAHDDVVGVEVGGAVKTVMAIAAGICDGLELGHNARAALITRTRRNDPPRRQARRPFRNFHGAVRPRRPHPHHHRRHLSQPPGRPAPRARPGAMLNMDMVGRMRGNRVPIMGTRTATEWEALLAPLCQAARVDCSMGGDGYGPSDHMPFYTAGVPVLFFFTGAHIDYHRGSDDADRIHAAGGAQVARLVSSVAEALATRPAPLSFQRAPMPESRGDVRAAGASLGTVPAYGEEGGTPGVLLADVRAGGPADQAGVRGGDRIVAIDDVEIRSISDLMFVLRQATPGHKAVLRVVRGGKLLSLEAVYGAPSQRVGR